MTSPVSQKITAKSCVVLRDAALVTDASCERTPSAESICTSDAMPPASAIATWLSALDARCRGSRGGSCASTELTWR